jgi:fatty acid synthase, animal type
MAMLSRSATEHACGLEFCDHVTLIFRLTRQSQRVVKRNNDWMNQIDSILLAAASTTMLLACAYGPFAGIKDPTSVNVDATLGDLGLDSLMGVEIKQTLERNFDITLSAKEIRSLTFARLDELSSGKPKTESGTEAAISQPVPSADIRYQLKHLMPTEEMVKLNSFEGSAETPVFVVTPIDGSVLLLESLMSHVNVGQVYGLQCTESTPLTSVADMANEYIKVRG